MQVSYAQTYAREPPRPAPRYRRSYRSRIYRNVYNVLYCILNFVNFTVDTIVLEELSMNQVILASHEIYRCCFRHCPHDCGEKFLMCTHLHLQREDKESISGKIVELIKTFIEE